MKPIKLFVLCIAGACAFMAGTAQAQATRTWVSGVGDDANPCSRTAPCKTFAGAISKTAAGGEINCLDPGGFGGVTITKAIAISCNYTEAGVLVSGTNGIVINAGVNDIVYLRGLDIHGVGTGLNGVRFLAGAALHIEDSVIRRFNGANGQGVSFQPSGTSELYIHNTTIADNGNGATGGGILVQPTGGAGNARVLLSGLRVHNNSNIGLFVNTGGNTSPQGVSVIVEDSSFSGNTSGVRVESLAGTNTATLMLTGSEVVNNIGTGLITRGSGATMRVGNASITGNGTGLDAGGGTTLASYGDNRNISNPVNGVANNGTFTATIPNQ